MEKVSFSPFLQRSWQLWEIAGSAGLLREALAEHGRREEVVPCSVGMTSLSAG